MKYLLLLILYIGSQACTFNQGPCNYEEIRFKASVAAISPYKKGDKQLYEVVLRFNNSSLYGAKQTLNDLKKHRDRL